MRILLLLVTVFGSACLAADITNPVELAAKIEARVANEGRTGLMHFELVNKRGKQRSRSARMYHAERNGVTQVAIYFVRPAALANTNFLSVNHGAADENWLYLPTTDRVRRLPASERGDNFMGTDLTFGDIQDNFKFPSQDWEFGQCEQPPAANVNQPCLAGVARNASIAKQLGYGRFVARIDTQTWFPSHIEFFDPTDRPLKTVRLINQEKIGNAWTAMSFDISHARTGHTTKIRFTEMREAPELPTEAFDPTRLDLGLPEL